MSLGGPLEPAVHPRRTGKNRGQRVRCARRAPRGRSADRLRRFFRAGTTKSNTQVCSPRTPPIGRTWLAFARLTLPQTSKTGSTQKAKRKRPGGGANPRAKPAALNVRRIPASLKPQEITPTSQFGAKQQEKWHPPYAFRQLQSSWRASRCRPPRSPRCAWGAPVSIERRLRRRSRGVAIVPLFYAKKAEHAPVRPRIDCQSGIAYIKPARASCPIGREGLAVPRTAPEPMKTLTTLLPVMENLVVRA